MVIIMIEIKNLTKKYKDIVAVDNLSLSIKKGELFSLLGVNGAGKTTTIKMLCTLTSPDSGDAFLNGNSIVLQKNEVKKIISVSPQETAVAPNLTVKENLELMCSIHGYSKKEQAEKIKELASDFDFYEILGKKAGKLSGGFQRRISIAMALISEPEIIFLDEPTLGLDVIARSELWDKITALKEKCTIILTTHYMEEARSLADRVGIMKNGKLLAVGTAEEIMKMTGCEKFEDAFIKVVKGDKNANDNI